MSYIDAYYNKSSDEIFVAERVHGRRVFKNYPAVYRAYYTDPKGRYESIYGDRLSKLEKYKLSAFNKELRMHYNGKIFESDIDPVFRCLEEHYLNKEYEQPNVYFFDIETNFDPNLGFSDPWNPYAEITAITIYTSQSKQLITLVLKPFKKRADGTEYVTMEEAQTIVSKFENTLLFTTEAELLEAFLTLIEDADILSGWNSGLYDIPYVVNRIEKVLGKNQAKRMCLWGVKPKLRKFTRFKKEMKTYDLVGRVHLDYLDLYRKHNPKQLHSYRLDFIGEIEVGENKEQYSGTFDQLYNEEFEHFIRYNRQDVMLLVKIDEKQKYIDLANQIAHSNCVLFKTTTGSVVLIEQAITLEAHSRNLIVPNRPPRIRESFGGDPNEENDFDVYDYDVIDDDDDDDDDDNNTSEFSETGKAAAGAYVAQPKKGLKKWVGAIDINSLYPSVIRALNISPETIFGQIRLTATNALIHDRIVNQEYNKAEAWNEIFCSLEYESVMNRTDNVMVLDIEDTKETLTLTGKDIHDFIFSSNSNLLISANGTIFSLNKVGVIPSLLTRWYSERKQMQKKEKHYASLIDGCDISEEQNIHLKSSSHDDTVVHDYDFKVLNKLISDNNLTKLQEYINENGLVVHNLKIKPGAIKSVYYKKQMLFWGTRQLARKILLNSAYGALLNEVCKFFDQRMGQSVTLSGRWIAKHMNGQVNFEFTGLYDYKGDAVQYSDTDSVDKTTIIRTNRGSKTIEDIYELCQSYNIQGEKEYGYDESLKVLTYDPKHNREYYSEINYVYRHKVSKEKWSIRDENNNMIVMTNDHSIMAERDGILMELKPSEVMNTDILLTVWNESLRTNGIVRSKIIKIEKLENFDDEYVYDIGIKAPTPYFFGNNILVHNSSYFSCVPVMDCAFFKEKFPKFTLTVDNIIKLYDDIADNVNNTFAQFMVDSFHTTLTNGEIIKAGREIVAASALFVKKKKYACLMVDKEGHRYDMDGKPGKLKVMGLDQKRSDTNKITQDFLENILMDILTDKSESDIVDKIAQYRHLYKSMNPWEMGVPKKVNNLSSYKDKIENNQHVNMFKASKRKTLTVPGHVRASLNWNTLCDIHGDTCSERITDGGKVIMCYLKTNPYKMKSIAYPVDLVTLPDWFKTLPFDELKMVNTMIDKKINNLIGVLNWNLTKAKSDTTFSDLFTF